MRSKANDALFGRGIIVCMANGHNSIGNQCDEKRLYVENTFTHDMEQCASFYARHIDF